MRVKDLQEPGATLVARRPASGLRFPKVLAARVRRKVSCSIGLRLPGGLAARVRRKIFQPKLFLRGPCSAHAHQGLAEPDAIFGGHVALDYVSQGAVRRACVENPFLLRTGATFS